MVDEIKGKHPMTMPFHAARFAQGSESAMQLCRTLVLAVALVGCGSDSSRLLDPNIPPITDGNWYRPGVATTWQWQLQGPVNTAYTVDVYDIDLFDVSASTIALLHLTGKRVICYFSAGSFEDFRSDANRFPQEVLGNTLEGFADERWLDIRSSIVLDIMSDRLDIAVQKGCDGVEPDNVDGYVNNSGFDLTAADQLAFNRRIANAAHERGLAVALKNDLDQILDLIAYFDFSVNEQCHEFDECSLLQPFVTAGKAVFNAEYDSRFVSDAAVRDGMCATARADNLRTLILPLDLDDPFRFSCDS